MTVTVHQDLVSFQRRLEAAGVVAAVHADHLCVRPPLLSSVRVRYDGARLTFDPRSGAVSRTLGTATVVLASIVAVAAVIAWGVALPTVVGVGVLAALSGVFDVMRYVVTESAITRVSLLWAGRGPAAVGALGEGPAQSPHVGMPAETVRAPLRGE